MIDCKQALSRKKAVILAGGGALALAACATSSPPHPLEGTRWRLVDVETSGTSTRLTEELSSRHTLTFESERALMQLDCNRGNATWSASTPRRGNGTISFGPVASTRALCPRPTFGEELAAELPKAGGYTLTSDKTGLIIRTDATVYVFTRN